MSNEPFDDVHETRSLPFELFSKSPYLRAVVVAVLDKNQQQIAEDTKEFLKFTVIGVIMWWMHTNILIPLLVEMEISPLLFGMWNILGLGFLALAGLAGITGIIHAVWYARKHWKAQPSARIGGDSR